MPLSPRLRATLRSADQRLPAGVRRGARIALGRGRHLRGSALVTLVVTVRAKDLALLDECLTSLRQQEHRNLEVLLVVADEATRTAAVVRRHLAEDWRFRLVRQPARTVAEGRNIAAAQARGDYLGFVRPQDQLPASAVVRLLTCLEESGSDFAFGRVLQQQGLLRTVSDVPHPAHESTRSAVSLAEFPLAITDTFEENRLYRRDFYVRAGLSFPVSGTSATPALTAFAVAERFDALVETTYLRRARGAGRPVGAVLDAIGDLDGWLAEQRVLQTFLDTTRVPAMRQAWAFAVCDLEAVPLLDDVDRATDDQWSRLRDFLVAVRAEVEADTWAQVRAESRVKVWLALADERDALERFVAGRVFELGNRRTSVVDGAVVADFDGLEDLAVPADCLVMHERETPLRVRLHDAGWATATTIEVTLVAYVEFLGYPAAPTATVTLVADDGRRWDVPATAYAEPEANLTGGHRYQEYSPGGLRCTLDLSAIAAAFGGVEQAWFEVAVETEGLRRVGTVTSREDRSAVGLLGNPLQAPRPVAGRMVGLTPEPRGGVSLRFAPAPQVAVDTLAVQGRHVRGTLRGAVDGRIVARRADGVQAVARVGADGSFDLSLPDPSASAGLRRFACTWEGTGVTSEVAFPRASSGRFVEGTVEQGVVAGRSAQGFVELLEGALILQVREVVLGDGELRLRGRWIGAVPDGATAALVSRRATVSTPIPAGREVDLTLSLGWDEWGLGQTPLPTGVYQVAVTVPGVVRPDTARLVYADALAPALLSPQVNRDYRMTPVLGARGLSVRLLPPLADDERGPVRQRILQLWSGSDEVALDPSAVYFQSYGGVAATDSQRAIHEVLHRTRPDLTLYWAVASSATTVPEGAVPVLIYSREWYRVLGSATYLCNNIDFDRWFRRKPGQKFLQTFHGYPAKSMGMRLWRAKQFGPRRIGLELDRTSRDWTLILTPTPEMDVHYRDEYAYDGEIESSGYPRDDALLAPDADEVRERTRRVLGIGAGQTAVLYAPTWRDDQATNYRSATMTKHLDLESATTLLGDDYVFLMRGHRFHARGLERSGRSARLIDVTDYPEINDLILASDAAVLDYSSLRFDFGLTGRPMLFLVPDLSSYTGDVRGFLYPFEPTAPGPLLDDAEEVVAALKDLDRVRTDYAQAYAAFQATYNYLQDGHAAERVATRFFTP